MKTHAELELQFLLHVQPETSDQPWHAILERVGDTDATQLEFQSPLELARHVASLREPYLKPKSKGLK
jgi:hypothetical protein